jgi:integrase
MGAMLRPWRGSIIVRRGSFYLSVRDAEGRWRQRATGIPALPERRADAERLLAEVRAGLKAHADVGEPGPVTVRSWGGRWLKTRTGPDRVNDEARLRLHVYPLLGSMPLDEVRPRHLVEVVDRLRAAGRAPRTVRNVYSVMKALFRDARIADVLQAADPCILTHRQLGKIKDSAKFKRAEAVFGPEELAALVGDERLPQDRRVWYGLLGIGMLRTGEAAGLRWGRVQRAEPLGRLVVATSYDKGRTKTDTDRWMPVHPTLAAALAAWRLGGWAREFGRPPTDDDLVLPVPPTPKRRGRRRPAGSLRTKDWARKRLVADLAVLGLRLRRGHDLRRTGISLAQDGGADSRVLRWGTHAPPGETIDGYTTLAWGTLCRAVSFLVLPVRTEAGAVRASKDIDPG